MKRSRQTASTACSELQEQFALRRSRVPALSTETTRWLDIDSFVDCNVREHELINEDLSQLKHQIEMAALKLANNGQLMTLQAALDRERRAYKEKSLRNFRAKLENEDKVVVSHQQTIEQSTKKIEEMSRELGNLQDAQQRYRAVASRRDFFELYERLCRECEKLRSENEQLQLGVGTSLGI